MSRTVWFLAPFMGVNTWRNEWPAMELERRGYPVRYVDRETPGGLRERLDHFFTPADTVVLHVSNMIGSGLERFVADVRPKVRDLLLQFDDDYFSHRDIQVDDSIRSHPMISKRTGYSPTAFADGPSAPGEIEMEFAPAPTLNSDIVAGVRGCTGVIAATEGVAEAYRPYAPWVEVIPNRMPEEISRYAAGSQRRRRTIAYLAILDPMGTQGVAPHYLDAMLVTDAIGRRPVHVIGGSDGSGEVFRNVTYTGRPLLSEVRYPRRETGALYHALAGFRVAIAPLLDTKWNRAKSWIKPLEAATVGVPCVASRTPEYVRLYNADVPVWLAETDDEWQTYLDFFLGMGETEWRTLSESLRLAAREQSIERHSEWSDLLDRL